MDAARVSCMHLDDDRQEDFSDLRLDGGSTESSVPPIELDERSEGPNWPLIWVAVLLVVAILGVYFGFFRGRQQAVQVEAPETPPPAVESPRPEPPVAAEEPIELPGLDASDAVVRELVSRLTEHPRLATWLATDELVRRFAVAVDNVAEGRSPRRHLPFLAPSDSFVAGDRSGLTVVDASSYRRYEDPARLFASLDAAAVAKLYRTLSPLLAEAYRDLGYPSRDFDATLARAIDELISTPIPQGEVALVPKVSSYEFADPSLEKLSPAQKHLVRMGPANARTIQRKLTEIRDELGLD